MNMSWNDPGCYPDLMQKSLLAESILTSAVEWIECLPHGCSGDQSFSSVAQSCPTLCNPMDSSTPGFPLYHQTPRAYSVSIGLVMPNSCPLGWWCHPTISSSVVLFPSRLQSFPVSGSFLMSWFFPSDGQSIGVSASASVLPMSIQDWKWSCSVVSDSLRPHGLKPTKLLSPWNFPGKNTGVGCHFHLQRIFPTQGVNPGLLHCRQTLYRSLSHQGKYSGLISFKFDNARGFCVISMIFSNNQLA